MTPNPQWLTPFLLSTLDLFLVLVITYFLLMVVSEGKTLWMVRGLVLLMGATVLTQRLGLRMLTFVLEKLVLGSAVAMAVIFQTDLRRFLERLGRGNILQMLQNSHHSETKPDAIIDEIVDAVRELSQRRVGALIVMETNEPIEAGEIPVPGVEINANISKELLQTIFQPTTLLHDGAVLIRNSQIVSAGMILPLSQRSASRQLGTRHRAAMGVTEQIPYCLCIVVSEETGSISLAEKGVLNRPLTSNKLREILLEKFGVVAEERSAKSGLRSFNRQLVQRGAGVIQRLVDRFQKKSSKNASDRQDIP
ncbi:MAG: TIGR00159 family protein [Coleofasciculaceae cyanobacterium SM2_1_6]|nr:TIGR00159 family protein [Coleofasciculaceae cyanobacterium SM2_1_6]